MATSGQKCEICNERVLPDGMSLFCEECVPTTVDKKLSTMKSMKEKGYHFF